MSIRYRVLMLLCATLAGTHAWGQNDAQPSAAADAAPGIDQNILNPRPAFLVAADVNRASRDYREGDSLYITVTSEEDAYLYVLYQQADGATFQVFPNRLQPNNLVQARQTVRVPGENDLFRWVVGGPFGKEVVKVIAAKEPLDLLSRPEFAAGRFNRVNAADLKGIEVELGPDKPIRWGETDVEIHTYANALPPETDARRRWGVFFGVSRHRFTPYVVAAEGKDKSMDLYACHRDAQKFAETMRTVGRLDGLKLFTNEEATKANMEEAITRWLPSVSHPGDMVLIYYSGHTGQIDDESGDEPDKQDELIIPHDFLGGQEFSALKTLYEQDKLSADERSFFEQLVQKYEGKSILTLVADTGVTDDLMARWVQRLAGRQVVFISDSCHSGGFATDEAAFKDLRPNFAFDLMQGEIGRLKDLGQSNQAILCAAHANEVAAERVTRDLGVMTYCLVDLLNRPAGAQRLEDCFKFCETEMDRYFAAWNRALEEAGIETRVTPSHPFLINNSAQPVILKP